MKRTAALSSAAVLLMLALSGCVTTDGTFPRAADGNCERPDHATHVSGGGQCLAIETVVRPDGGKADVLVVMVHGDGTEGRWAAQVRKWMGEGLRLEKSVAVVDLARPGYAIVTGKSSGTYVRSGGDNYNNRNVQAVMEAIDGLRRHYGAKRVVALSRSGGSAIVAIGLGRHPDIAPDEAILVACPCDTVRWVAATGSRGSPPNSPIAYVGGVRAGTKVTMITGSLDDNTVPELAQVYVEALKARGIDALFYLAPGFRHIPSSSAPIVRQHLDRAARRSQS